LYDYQPSILAVFGEIFNQKMEDDYFTSTHICTINKMVEMAKNKTERLDILP
jgi:hypothetical protein